MKYKISELGTVIGGGTPSTKHSEYYTNKGISWITPKDLSNYHSKIIYHGARDITNQGLKKSSAKILPAQSVLVSSRAPIGYVAIAGTDVTTNQGFKSIIPNTHKILPDYLYYLMLNSKKGLQQVASGSTFKEVSGRVMKNFEVEVPTLAEQKRVISVINPIVNKIELNSQINDNLDALLTTLFNNVTKDKSKYHKSNLTEIANYKNGLAMQKYRPNGNDKGLPVLKIKELNEGNVNASSDKCSSNIDKSVVVNTGDIIFSWSGTLLVKNWSGIKSGLNQHLFKVTSENYPLWFIYEWTKYHLRKFQSIAAGKATTMGHIKRKDLKNSIVYIPDADIMKKLNKLMAPLYNKRIEILNENLNLTNLKNSLLNKFF